MTQTDIKLYEALFDIAFEAGFMVAKGELHLDDADSREVFHSVLHLAEEFEAGFSERSEGHDYLSEVLEFSHRRLTEMYGDDLMKG